MNLFGWLSSRQSTRLAARQERAEMRNETRQNRNNNKTEVNYALANQGIDHNSDMWSAINGLGNSAAGAASSIFGKGGTFGSGGSFASSGMSMPLIIGAGVLLFILKGKR